jgi:hypothetical protein
MSRLFAILKNRQSRIELCNIFKTIGQLDSQYENIYKLVHDVIFMHS